MSQATQTAPEAPVAAQAASAPEKPKKPPIIGSKLRLFIILSLGLHFGVAVVYGIPEYLRRLEEERLAKEAREKAERLREYEKKRKEEEKRKKKEETKEEIAEELKEDYDRIVQDDLTLDESNQLWDDILEALDPELGEYADQLVDPEVSDAQLGEALNQLKGSMVQQMAGKLKEVTARKLAEQFLKTVKSQVVPAIAKHYQTEIDRRIAKPLEKEGQRIVREEKTMAEREKKALEQALDRAQKDAEKAKNELAASKERIDKARDEAAKRDPAAKDKAADAAKAEAKNIADAKKKLGEATAESKNAANKLEGPEASAKADTASKKGEAAEKKAGDAQAAAEKGDAANAKKDASEASHAARKAGEEMETAKKSVDASSGDPQSKAEAKKSLDEANKKASDAEKSLNESAERIARAEAEAEAGDKTLAAATKREEKSAANAEAAIKSAEKNLEDAAKRSEFFGGNVEEKVGEAKEGKAEEAGKAAAVAKSKDAEGRAAEAQKKTNDAAKSAEALAKAVGEAKEAAAKSEFDPAKLAKAVLNEVKDTDIKKTMEGAFKEGFEKEALPRLSETLQKSFEGQLASNGMRDKELVNEVGREIKKMLGEDVPEQTKPGETSTKDLAKDVEGAKHDANRNAKRESSVAKKASDAAQKLAETEMSSITGGGKSDSAFAKMASQASSSSSESQSLLERVSTMASNVSEGRMGFLEGGAAGVSDLRRGALKRSQGRPTKFHAMLDQKAYDEATKDVRERDKEAAQGEAWEREGAEGETSAGEASEIIVRSAVMLMPPEPEGKVEGEAEEKDPFKPTFKTRKFGTMPYMNGKIELDGDLAEWEEVEPLKMRPSIQGGKRGSFRVADQFVKVAWDNKGFYFAYDVVDADGDVKRVPSSHFWEGDAVEIFVEPENLKGSNRSRATQQFWVWPDGQGGNREILGGECVSEKGKGSSKILFTKKDIQTAAKLKGERWVLEVHIPFERIQKFDPQPGRILGFEFSICTGTTVDYYWSGDNKLRPSEHPDTWGDILLAGSDAKVEIPDKFKQDLKDGEEPKPARAIVIGEPLKLRVTDPDMNLSDKKKDKVSVTVKTSNGDNEVAILEETEDASGIFEGSLPTALSLGEPIPQKLSLYEGEKLDLIYMDQARANGTRNVEVKLEHRAAAGTIDLAGGQ